MGQNNSGWWKARVVWVGPLSYWVDYPYREGGECAGYLRLMNQFSMVRPVMGNKPKAAGPPWPLIIQCCSFLELTGYETSSSPAVETHWGSIGPVGNHNSVCRHHLADCWLPEQLLKAAVHATIHSINCSTHGLHWWTQSFVFRLHIKCSMAF